MTTLDITDAQFTTIIDQLNRRSLLLSMGVLTMVAACGTTETSEDSTAETVTANTPYGTFEVPVNPKRLVILEGRQDLEVAIALRLPKPVGLGDNAVGDDGSPQPYVPFDIDGVELIAGGTTPLEKVIALNPDLIIGRASNIDEIKDALLAVAPVIPVERDRMDWRTSLIDAGRWTGRSAQAAEALAGYDEHVNEVKMRHAEKIGTTTTAMLQVGTEGKWYSCNSNGFYLQARTTRNLGAKYLPILDETKQEASAYGPPGAMIEFSDELLPLLEPADLIVAVINDDEMRASLEANPLWQRLPAVQSGRVRYTDWRTNSGSVFAAHECLRLWDEAFALLA